MVKATTLMETRMTQVQRDNANTSDTIANANNVDSLRNAPEVQEYGKQASAAWSDADKFSTKGDQLAILALFHAFHKVTFSAVVKNRKGETEDVSTFELADLAKEPKNNDGTRDNKMITARTVTIAKEVFGLSEEQVTQSFKNRLSRAMEVVFLFVSLGYTEDQVTLTTKKNAQGRVVQMLKLPFTSINKAPEIDSEGKIDEEELDHYNRLKDSFVVLDGTKGKTVAELQRRAQAALHPAKSRNAGANATNPQDKGQAFKGSVQSTIAFLHMVLDNEDESEIAINNELRYQLWELQHMLAQFFDIDPLTKDEETMLERKQAKAS
ncbi:MAG: hypothetical protein IM525_02960 [Microcystis sp. M43BS1]|nr:hypothetical protein [Microcystis sp. M43BS1]